MHQRRLFVVCLFVAAPLAGCGPTDTAPPKAPRPVSVITLAKIDPDKSKRLPGNVVSWKTDKIGFEVTGRVTFAIETETDIQGRVEVVDSKGKRLIKGTPLARIDPERYELQLQSVQAKIDATEKQRKGVRIELEKVIPAKENGVIAQRDLAKDDVKRYTKLINDGAAGQRELDVVKAKLDTAIADLQGLNATKEAKKAEIESLNAQIRELQQQEEEAKRDLRECELSAPFSGQIAEVYVIPGSLVDKGQPVVTIQMMEPIKVAFEVSATTARSLNHRDPIKLHIPLPGTEEPMERVGVLWSIDAIADPQTRTFTVTAMVRNEKTRQATLKDIGDVAASTKQITVVVEENDIKPGALFVNEKSIQKDSEDNEFLWKITNRWFGVMGGESGPLLQVAKVRIKSGDLLIPFLGFMNFREIKLLPGEKLDIKKDLITSKVEIAKGKKWDGKTVLLDKERWLLRPGDQVQVGLQGGGSALGFYVPLNAISENSGKFFVFEANDGKARKIQVNALEQAGTLRRIEAIGGAPLRAGMKIIADGAHYIVDGEGVAVAKEVGAQQ